MYFCEGISSSDIRKVMLKKLYFSKRKTIFMFWWGQLQKEKTNSKRKTNFSKKKRKRTNFLFQNKNIFIQKRKKKLFQKKKYFLQRINILFSPYKKKKAGEKILIKYLYFSKTKTILFKKRKTSFIFFQKQTWFTWKHYLRERKKSAFHSCYLKETKTFIQYF